MKKALLSLSFLACLSTNVTALPFAGTPSVTKVNLKPIDDGWYEAIVSYYNSNTYTTSKYKLNVKVQYNNVVAIDFGNGGSVHSGYNNEGYYYTGGMLSTGYDDNVTTTVNIAQGSQMVSYRITLL